MTQKTLVAMTRGEKLAGWIFFALYFLLLPSAMGWVSRLLAEAMVFSPDSLAVPLLYYLALLIVTLAIFHKFLLRSFRAFLARFTGCLKVICLSLLIYLGVSVLLSPLTGSMQDPNRLALVDQMAFDRGATLLITLVLIPVVTEVLFRALVFESVAHYNRLLGYVVSIALFALLNVWQHVFFSGDWSYAVLLLRYAVPGAILVWCYERSGSVWAAVLLHALINAVAAFLATQ